MVHLRGSRGPQTPRLPTAAAHLCSLWPHLFFSLPLAVLSPDTKFPAGSPGPFGLATARKRASLPPRMEPRTGKSDSGISSIADLSPPESCSGQEVTLPVQGAEPKGLGRRGGGSRREKPTRPRPCPSRIPGSSLAPGAVPERPVSLALPSRVPSPPPVCTQAGQEAELGWRCRD